MDLEKIAFEYQNSLSDYDRKILGKHYTRFEDAMKLVTQVLSFSKSKITRVLEPSSGGGIFAVALYHCLKDMGYDGLDIINNILVCVDIDSDAAQITEKVLKQLEPTSKPTIIVDDTLKLIINRDPRIINSDLIIGNPPYVRIHNLDEINKEYYKNNFSCFIDKADLSVAFIEGCFDILSEDGVLGFIVSNTFARSKSGAKIRQKIKPHLCVYDEINSDNKFDAMVSVVDLILTKNLSNFVLYNNNCVDYIGDDEWIFEKSQEITDGVTLKDMGIKLQLGIVTGCNEIMISKNFGISKYTRPIARGKNKNSIDERVIFITGKEIPSWPRNNLTKEQRDILVAKACSRKMRIEGNDKISKKGVYYWKLQSYCPGINWDIENWIIPRIGSTLDDFYKIPAGTVCLDTCYVLYVPKQYNKDKFVNYIMTQDHIKRQFRQLMNKLNDNYEIHSNKFLRICIPRSHLSLFADNDGDRDLFV